MNCNILILLLLLNKNPFLPSIEDTIIIKEWLCVGPFSIGAREGIIGVDDRIELGNDFRPNEGSKYPSILAQGGKVKWQRLKSEDGEVKVEYKDVLWDTIQDYYGAAGVFCAGYAYADFYNKAIKRALIIAQGISSFRLNGKLFPGDRYRHGYLKVPVVLRSGENKILLKLSGFGDHKFRFKIVPVFNPVIIIGKDVTLPDFIRSEVVDAWVGIPILNTTNQRILNIKLQIEGKNIRTMEQKIPGIMPLSVIKIPVKIESDDIIDGEADSLLISIKLLSEDFFCKEDFWIKIRDKNESFVKTFISKIDGSCQYYAVLPPRNYNKDSTYALIMTLHGAGVEARSQVRAYTQKNWTFIVAPTNRRRFGFDWQDWGRLDFLEVLADVNDNFRIDPNRIYLTGHSMGGHGVWHIGLSHPDIFAAIAPSAGWTCFQLYIPFFLQKSYLFAHPELIKFRDMVLREDITPLFLENAHNLPIYVLQGGLDNNVPPIQARIFNKYLTDLDYNFVYNEVDGEKHWWDIDSTPGVDCVDSKELMGFLKSKKRDPYPKHVIFKTCDIDHSNRAYWVRIDELENIYQEGKIDIENAGLIGLGPRGGSIFGINVKVMNIKKFSILLNESIIPLKSVVPPVIKFMINGQKIEFKYKEECEISFYKDGDKYKIDKKREKKTIKKKGFYGPIKRAYFSPFVLVYGTIGDSSSTENNLHQARLQSYTWWYRANGFVEILPDTEVTEEIIVKHNLILFGNSKTHSGIKIINAKLPIHFKENHWSLGKELIKKTSIDDVYISIDKQTMIQRDLCLLEIYPNPLNPEKFVVLYSPTSKDAEKLMGLFTPLYSGSGLPDYIVYDKSVLKYGWAGVVAAGFFDKEWKFDKNLSFIKY